MKKQRNSVKKRNCKSVKPKMVQVEETIINNIYEIIDEIYGIINKDTRNAQNTNALKTENITMNIARNSNYSINSNQRRNIDSSITDNTGDDNNVVLVTGSQLYPGTSFSNQSHAYRMQAQERAINTRLRNQARQQRINNIMNRYRSLSRSHHNINRTVNRAQPVVNRSQPVVNRAPSRPNRIINSLAMAA